MENSSAGGQLREKGCGIGENTFVGGQSVHVYLITNLARQSEENACGLILIVIEKDFNTV